MAEAKFPEYNNALNDSWAKKYIDLQTFLPKLLGRSALTGAAKGGDNIANFLAGLVGGERENPSAMEDKTIPGLDRSLAQIQKMDQGASQIPASIRNTMGWKEKKPVPLAAAPTGALAANPEKDRYVAGVGASSYIPTPGGGYSGGSSSGALTGQPPDANFLKTREFMSLPPDAQEMLRSQIMAGGPTRVSVSRDGIPTDVRGEYSATPALPAMAPPIDIPTSPTEAVQPRKAMADIFREHLASIKKPEDGGITPEQKNMALLESSLAMMQASSRPGAKMLGAFGEAGQRGTALMREQQKENSGKAEKAQSEQLRNILTEMGLVDKDRDNERSDTREVRDGKRLDELIRHTKTSEGQKNTELQIRRMLADGRLTQMEANLRIAEMRAQMAHERANAGSPLMREINDIAALTGRSPADVAKERFKNNNPDEMTGAEKQKFYLQARAKNDADIFNSGKPFPSQEEFFRKDSVQTNPVKGEKSTVNGKTAIFDGKKWVPQ